MFEPYPHRMMPRASHDELARQNYVAAFKIHAEEEVYPRSKDVYAARVAPAFTKAHTRAPSDRHEVRRAFLKDDFAQMWSAVARTLQEMMWDNVGESIERQLPTLIDRAKIKNPKGTLRLNPDVKIPRYNAAIDIHCMPGGYGGEITEDDVYAGALVDRGGYYYVVPFMGYRANTFKDTQARLYGGAAGSNIMRLIRQEFPNFEPRRILDMGCGIGRGTFPYLEMFADAEVHAIDVAAPQLRYAHARAEAFGRCIHFSQHSAEATDFADGSFDLVVSHGLCHETSGKAIRNIMSEIHRVLKPGGITMHSDPQLGRGLDPHDAFIHDWDTYYNNEPFWGPLHDIGATNLFVTAGFPATSVREAWATIDASGSPAILMANDTDSELNRSSLFGARKAAA
jgi:ubiquinone/menaquinone biosynthesis C-methylase UbiE